MRQIISIILLLNRIYIYIHLEILNKIIDVKFILKTIKFYLLNFFLIRYYIEFFLFISRRWQ